MIQLARMHHRILDIPLLLLQEGTIAVIGPNGAGKSTLLRLIAGVEVPEKGTILINGNSPRLTEIGWVDENPERSLLFDSVSDELASPLRFRWRSCPEVNARVTETIGQLGISSLLSCRARDLSAGEKVLVALGAALIQKPDVMILDEADSHLDPAMETEVRKTLASSGLRHLLFTTQHMDAAGEADQVVFLDDGHVLWTGPPSEVFSHLHDTCFYPPSWRGSG